ncbi:hypothetical protein [Hymenobacter sp.]|uniref:hypothetical protein n=1 Tax=Hymenobacter sp. TaxID=1898978 RepID=UPI00286A6263|nr:hypothetical protein [Hymenobacter sp.]
MRVLLTIGLLSLFLRPPAWAADKPGNYLAQCWRQQGQQLAGRYAVFSFREQANELEHSFSPWQQTAYAKRGTAWVNAENFLKQDTLVQQQKTLVSKTQLSGDVLLRLDYGDQKLAPVTPEQFAEQLFQTARYSPLPLLSYFVRHPTEADERSRPGFAVYTTRLPRAVVSLVIRKSDGLVDRVEVLSDDELFGDVRTTFTYRDYAAAGKFAYPKTVSIDKLGGKVRDEVAVTTLSIADQAAPLLQRPADYHMKPAGETKAEVVVQRFSPNLHFIELKHTDDRVLVVEFRDFLVVAEAPLNSANGERIVAEARRLAPGKPIRYFVFGHYHPHYLGGLRPFVRRGATVLCGPGDAPYVRYLAEAPRTLRPDSLHLAPRPATVEEIAGTKTITDGQFEMQIHFIGKQSEHTNDYLIYYFPSEKLLFEDDLAWVPCTGAVPKARARQAGLYQAVRDRKLDVKTVVQSWPVADYGVKTVIPFADLEQAMQVK